MSVPQPVESEVRRPASCSSALPPCASSAEARPFCWADSSGGGRALYRIARGKPASSVYDEEFIHLDLREDWIEDREAIPGAASEGLTSVILPVEK